MKYRLPLLFAMAAAAVIAAHATPLSLHDKAEFIKTGVPSCVGRQMADPDRPQAMTAERMGDYCGCVMQLATDTISEEQLTEAARMHAAAPIARQMSIASATCTVAFRQRWKAPAP